LSKCKLWHVNCHIFHRFKDSFRKLPTWCWLSRSCAAGVSGRQANLWNHQIANYARAPMWMTIHNYSEIIEISSASRAIIRSKSISDTQLMSYQHLMFLPQRS
jgi:hypothetical protein